MDPMPPLKHGLSNTPIYYVWFNMLERCRNPKNHKYPRYGGRGIVVCERWRNSLSAFVADMGPKPSPKHRLDRIDNNGPYTGPCPEYPQGNCHWATDREQAKNRSTTVEWVEFQGRRQLLREWARELQISYRTLRRRYDNGWPVDQLLSPHSARYSRRCKLIPPDVHGG